MRFLHFGDMHEDIEFPASRKDDFRATMNRKIEEIKSIGKAHGVTAFLQPGDFLSKPKYDYKFLAEVIQRWTPLDMNQLIQMILSGQFTPEKIAELIKGIAPIVGVVGNHELFGNSLPSLHKTSINFLNQVGLLQFATKENPIFFTTEEGLKVAITGSHYHIHMDKPEHIDDYVVEEKLGDFHIHIVHGYLTNKNFGTLFRHTTVDEVAKRTKADLTISGHDHIGFDLMEVDGKLFVNPGSPVRLSNDLKEMKRRPKVLLIDITKEGIKVKNIYLKTAQKGEEVLDRTKIVQKQASQDKMQQIKSMVQKALIKKGADITEIIEGIATNKNLALKIKDELLDRVVQKMKEMNVEYRTFEEYYITKIVLENFQSHEYTVLDCSEGLNIYVGESRQGKTSTLRALGWIYEDNAKNSRRFIKKGKEYAKATIYLSNGYIISRLVEKKKSGKNGYEVYNPHTQQTDYQNTTYLPVVQEILGFTTLNIGTSKPIPLNFLRQGKSWFFIGDEMTSTERAKVIGCIYGTHYADAVIKELEAEDKKLTQQIKDRQKDLTEYNDKIGKYHYLPQLEKDINEVEALYAKVLELKAKRDKIEEVMNRKAELKSQIKELQGTIKSLDTLEEAKQQISVLKGKIDRRNKVCELFALRRDIAQQGASQRQILVKTETLPEAKKQLEILKELCKKKAEKEVILNEANKIIKSQDEISKKIKGFEEVLLSTNELSKASDKLKRLKELQIKKAEKLEILKKANEAITKRDNFAKQIEVANEVIKATDNLDGTREKLEKLKELYAKRVKVQEILVKKKQIAEDGKKFRKQMTDAVNRNEKLVEEYKELLQKAGKCPVCLGTIDKATINRIVDKYGSGKKVS